MQSNRDIFYCNCFSNLVTLEKNLYMFFLWSSNLQKASLLWHIPFFFFFFATFFMFAMHTYHYFRTCSMTLYNMAGINTSGFPATIFKLKDFSLNQLSLHQHELWQKQEDIWKCYLATVHFLIKTMPYTLQEI